MVNKTATNLIPYSKGFSAPPKTDRVMLWFYVGQYIKLPVLCRGYYVSDRFLKDRLLHTGDHSLTHVLMGVSSKRLTNLIVLVLDTGLVEEPLAREIKTCMN